MIAYGFLEQKPIQEIKEEIESTKQNIKEALFSEDIEEKNEKLREAYKKLTLIESIINHTKKIIA